MERKPLFWENHPFNWSELFIGNWDLFKEVLQNPETIFVWDIDGILANLTEVVFKNFFRKTGIYANPLEINNLDYLTKLATAANLGKEIIEHAEDDWYNPDVLLQARKYLYIKPVVHATFNLLGPENNYVLTSRKPRLEESTFKWFGREFPEFLPVNIMINADLGFDSAAFKAGCLWWLSQTAPWVVFIDDSTKYIKAALDLNIPNLVAVNIPQGKDWPQFSHEQLLVFKRYPEEIQAMYPLMYAVDRALGGI